MTEGKWNCMLPVVLGRCAPKPGLIRVPGPALYLRLKSWAFTTLLTLLSLFVLRSDLVDFSTIFCEADKYLSLFFLSHPCWDNSPQSPPGPLASWNPQWTQLHGDLRTGLVRAAWMACPSIPLKKHLSCYIICWWFFYELILIKPYSECWIGCTEVIVENKRKKKNGESISFPKAPK